VCGGKENKGCEEMRRKLLQIECVGESMGKCMVECYDTSTSASDASPFSPTYAHSVSVVPQHSLSGVCGWVCVGGCVGQC
jgi:hypothetical protein